MAPGRWLSILPLPGLLPGLLLVLPPALPLTLVGQPSAQQDARRPIETVQQQPATSQRTRLILKDGSYQVVFSYKVQGKVVTYRSAERDNAAEDIPLALVDLPATERWYREHVLNQRDTPPPPVLSPELAREEADRAALTPEIAPHLRLPEEDSVLALDTFRGQPELVPLPQAGSDLNKETAHAVQPLALKPQAAPHRIAEIAGFRAEVQLHVADPVFYVRLGTDDGTPLHSGALTVDTSQSPANPGRPTPAGSSDRSDYIIERVDARATTRIVSSPRLQLLGAGHPQPDVIECRADPLPGGHWLRLTPLQPLDFGEYALLEVLSSHAVNLDVWEFGIHPAAQENVEALHPEAPRTPTLRPR